jgi:hypothetical protein
MLNQIESDYDCSQAGFDLHSLNEEADALKASNGLSKEKLEELNRIENQIHFIENKCSINNG